MEKYVEFESPLYTRESDTVKWLFELLREFDDKMKAKFLFYVFGKLFL